MSDSADSETCWQVEGGGCGSSDPPMVSCDAQKDTGASDTAGTLAVEGGGCSGCAAPPAGVSPWPLLFAAALALFRRSAWLALPMLIVNLAHAADAQHLQAMDGGRFLTLIEPWRGAPWSTRAGLTTSYARKLVVLRQGEQESLLLDRVWTHEAAASVILGKWIRLGVGMPLHGPYQLNGRPASGALRGDINFWSTLYLSNNDARIQRSWTVGFDVPSTAYASFLGDVGAIRGRYSSGRAINEKTRLGLELGVRLQQAQQLPGVLWGRRLEGGLGVDWMPTERIGMTAELMASGPLGEGDGRAALPVEMLGTVRAGATDSTWVRLGAGVGLTKGLGAPSWRLVLSLYGDELRPDDRDGDGIVDLRDSCRDIPEDYDQFEDRDGCPEPDNDRDGYPDAKDRCPNEAEVFNNHDDEDGCPDTVVLLEIVLRSRKPELLERGRVVVDDFAKEVIPGEVTRFHVPPSNRVLIEAYAEDHHRLIKETAVTSDRRVVLTMEPIRWGDVRLRVTDPQGVPLAAMLVDPDLDVPAGGLTLRMPAGSNQLTLEAPGFKRTDVVVDVAIEARQEVVVVLEPAGPWLEDTRLRVSDRIRFALDSAELTDESASILQDIADWLTANPAIRLLRIEGLADEIGSPSYNHRLSIDRARAVRKWLVQAGVSSGRLEAIGSGEALANPETRNADRSVRFLVVVWDAGLGERPAAAIETEDPTSLPSNRPPTSPRP